jgi:putative acetyltransferase
VLTRAEIPDDIAAIEAVHAAAFPTRAEARLVNLLRDAGRLLVSIVAEVEDRIVGHVAFSPVTTPQGLTGLGLAPLAVHAPFRRRGIGAALVQAGLLAARELDSGWVVVLGDPDYYARFGFRPAPAVGLTDEYGGGEAFQALELTPGRLPLGAGLVRYAPEFASLG